MAIIVPSLQCADPLNLERDVRTLLSAGAARFHIDIMDGHFVPNLALNFDHLRRLQADFSLVMDVHLMTEHPERFIALMEPAGIEHLAFHVEAADDPLHVLDLLRTRGMKGGIAVSPSTQPADFVNLLPHLDFILVMAVNPGRAGQTFMPESLDKVRRLRDTRAQDGYRYRIEIDGGTTFDNVRACVEAGADFVVAGATSIFKPGEDLAGNFRRMARLACR